MSFCSSWATLSKTRHLWFIHIHLFQSLHFFLSFLLSFLSPCDHQSLFVLSLKWCPGWTVLRPASRLSSGKFLTTFRHSFLLQSVRRQMSSYCSTLKSQVLKNTVSSLEGHSLLAAEKVQESSTHPMGAVSTLFLWSEEKKKKDKTMATVQLSQHDQGMLRTLFAKKLRQIFKHDHHLFRTGFAIGI